MAFTALGETNVNLNTAGEQFAPEVVWLAGGGYLVAWRDADAGEIKGRIFSATGTATGVELTLATAIDASGQGPALIAMATGGFAIAWTQDQTSGLFVQTFGVDGIPTSGNILITGNTVVSAFGLTESASGELLVTFAEDVGGPTEQVTLARVTSTLGLGTVSTIGVNGSTGTGFGAASVAELANGDTVVAYVREEYDPANGIFGFSVFARVIDASGAFANAEILLGALTTTDFSIADTVRPIVKALPNGNFAVTWADELVNVAVVDATTGALVQPITTFQVGGGGQNFASLDVAASGEFVVAWATPSIGLDGDGFGIQAQRFDQLGNAIGATFFANANGAGNQVRPDVAMQPNGDFAVVWTDLNSVRSGLPSADIELQAFQAAPPPPNGTLDFSTTPGALRFDFDQDGTAAGNSAATFVAVTIDGQGGRLDVSGANGLFLAFPSIVDGTAIAEADVTTIIGTTNSDVFTLSDPSTTRSVIVDGGGGSEGDSFLVSGGGSHTLRGGDGRDFFNIGAFVGSVTISGGADPQFNGDLLEVISLAGTAANFSLSNGPDADGFWSGSATGNGRNAVIRLKEVEEFRFGDADDAITIGGAYVDSLSQFRIDLGGGTDTLIINGAQRVSIFNGVSSGAADGANIITATGGFAFILARSGSDTIDTGEGGPGATDGDIISYASINADAALNPTGLSLDLAVVDAQGFATATITYASGAEVDRMRNAETIWGAPLGNDVLRAADNSVPFGGSIPELRGFGGDDLLIGRAGTNLLVGGGGNDRLEGGDGDDTLLGGRDSFGLRESAVQSDDDLLIGGRGDDLIYGDTSATFDRVGLVDTDIAQFAGNRADYDIVAITDSTGIAGFQITHARNTSAAANDGVDRVFQVETFRFADGDVPAAALLAPLAPVFTLRAPASPDRRVLVEEDGPAPGRTFEIEVSRSNASVLDAATVVLSLVGVSANPASAADVVDGFASRTVEFAAGETRKIITITVADDALVEAVEQFEVRIASTTLGTSDPTAILVSITSEDVGGPPPTFAITAQSATSVLEGTSPGAGGVVTFTVTRTSGDLGAARVSVAVQGGAAPAADLADLINGFGNGYVVDFAAGQTTATVEIFVTPDAIVEANENVRVQLDGANYGTVDPTAFQFTIQNDDLPPPPPPALSWQASYVGETLEGTPDAGPNAPLIFVLQRTGDVTQATTVTFALGGLVELNDIALVSARSGGAVTAVPGEPGRFLLTFDAGANAAEIEVLPVADDAVEFDEDVLLTLIDATGGVLPAATERTASGLILNDDAFVASPPLIVVNRGLIPLDAADVRVNTTVAGVQETPAVVTLSDGGHVVVWAGADGAGSFDIFGQRYGADGAPLGGEFRVNADSTGEQVYPAIAALQSGGFVVSWTDSSQNIVAQRFSADGSAAGGTSVVGPARLVSGIGHRSEIVPLSDGGFLIAWAEPVREGYGNASAQRFDAAGVAIGGVTTLPVGGAQTSMAPLVDGGYVVAGMTGVYNPAFSIGRLEVQSFNADGTPRTAAPTVVFELTRGAFEPVFATPAVAGLADGSFVVVWQQGGAYSLGGPNEFDPAFEIYAQRFRDGLPLSPIIQVNTTTAGGQFSPSVVGTPDGGYIVSWSSVTANGVDILATRFDVLGQQIFTEQVINSTLPGVQRTNPLNSSAPLTLSDDGMLVATFAGEGDVFVRRFDATAFFGREDGTIRLPITVTTTESDDTLTEIVLANLPPGSVLSAGTPLFSDGTAWILTPAQLANLSFTPPPNYNGVFTLAIGATAVDGTASATAFLSPIVRVGSVNDAPLVSGPLLASAAEDGASVTLDALANASDVDTGGAVLSVVNVPATLPAGVTFDPVANTFTLDPTNAAYQSLREGQTQTVTVAYGVSDGIATTPTSAVWTIAGANDAPVVSGDVLASATEDGASVTVSGLATTTDVDAGTVLSIVGLPPGLADIGITFDAAANTFTLDPRHPIYQQLAQGVSTTIQLTYGVTDGLTVVPARALFTITGTNDTPVVSSAVTGAATEDGGSVTLDALANATDVDMGAVLSVVNVPATLPAGVTFDAATNTFTLDPSNAAYQSLQAGESRTVSVFYGITDGIATVAQEARWSLIGVNDAAIIGGVVSGTVQEDAAVSTVTGQLTISDVDGPATFQTAPIATANGYGLATVTASGLWSYTLSNGNAAVNALNSGQTLSDSFVVRAADGTQQTINVTIQGATDGGGLNPITPPRGANVTGTPGGDLITINASNALVFAGGGDDTVRLTASTGLHLLDGGAGIDTVDFTALAADVSVDLAFDLAFYGRRAAIVRSFENAATGSGDDTLRGSSEDNVLSGGAGGDILEGRGGADVLTGGADGDTFVYEADSLGAARDRITDFQQGLDRIDLRSIDANTTVLGNQAFSGAISLWNGLGNPFAANAPGSIVYSYETINGVLSTVLSINNDADAAADLQIVLVGTYTPTASDFLL